ncbi:MAG: Long-chain-fatty-acid--CoA ligase, partial [Bacteroidota bacterium]
PNFLNKKINGKWVEYSSAEVYDIIHELALGLIKLGLKRNEKVAIISGNRPEWNFIDLAVQILGGVTVPIYPTITVEDFVYIFNDSQVKLVFVENEELLEKASEARKSVKSIEEIYTFNAISGQKKWDEILERGSSSKFNTLDKYKSEVDKNDLLTLIYTSGTTGKPKGVMLSHFNIISNVHSIVRGNFFELVEGDRSLSFLPMCHIYERTNIYLYFYYRVSIYYAESMETIADNIREVKPHVFATVPRLLEKVFDKIVAKGSELEGFKKKLFFGAIEFGLKYDPMESLSFMDKIRYSVYGKLIFSKWREALGGSIKLITSGSAALQPRLSRVFWAAGIPIAEGYGLTETSPVISVSKVKPPDFKIGCVGTIIDCMEVRIAEDGEILTKGDSVMQGYYNNPEATAEAIDKDGWFHTGDIGELVEGKYLKITDRKKEIFKTSGGKYVAPQMVENKLKESKFIEQCIVVGENQKFPSALLVPEFEALKLWANQNGINFNSTKDLIENTAVIKLFDQEVDKTMESVAQYEKVKKFILLSEMFTIEAGELTPTLKLKRKVLNAKYKEQIEGIYL